ncbi:hypothetical protein LUZ63_004582 [Rhynchospora breviuscula]|uniref:Uncharacterized protein n=1 Tax=Rhynchospora breviuscula TaxID=2022672 RepID=A0A9Q0CLE1_9POAL|nr:hypothetical protein LUZ63_004582 [Rhynchospora breviuscula]
MKQDRIELVIGDCDSLCLCLLWRLSLSLSLSGDAVPLDVGRWTTTKERRKERKKERNRMKKKKQKKNKAEAEHQSDDCCNTMSMDPLYKLFLDHLTPHGTSYILQIDDPHLGLPLYLKYEGGDTTNTNTSSYPTKTNTNTNTKRKPTHQIALAPLPLPLPLPEESYDRFLKHLKFKQGIMILELDGAPKVIYEQVTDNLSTNLPTPNALHSRNQGEENLLAAISPDLRSFDEKLAAVLSHPFDQREYDALMNEAIRRKPVMKHRNLRNMSKGYRTHEAGQSYLDYYPDLAIQIMEADKYERLNLLRKFFFWLENLCHDGAYMPWVPKALSDKLVFD